MHSRRPCLANTTEWNQDSVHNSLIPKSNSFAVFQSGLSTWHKEKPGLRLLLEASEAKSHPFPRSGWMVCFGISKSTLSKPMCKVGPWSPSDLQWPYRIYDLGQIINYSSVFSAGGGLRIFLLKFWAQMCLRNQHVWYRMQNPLINCMNIFVMKKLRFM